MTKRSLKLIAIAGVLFVTPPAAAQMGMSNRCVTAQFWCFLPGYGAIGSSCYCNTPYGPVPGIIR